MKKYILILLLSASVLSLEAQHGRRTWMVGGSVGIDIMNDKQIQSIYDVSIDGKNIDRTFSLSPEIGYFVGANWEIGAKYRWTFSKINGDQFMSINQTEATINQKMMDSYRRNGVYIFTRYFMPISSDKWYFSLQGEVGYLFGKQKMERKTEGEMEGPRSSEQAARPLNRTIKGWETSIIPEFWYYITPCLAINASVGKLNYQYTKSTIDGIPMREEIMNREAAVWGDVMHHEATAAAKPKDNSKRETRNSQFNFDWDSFDFGIRFLF